MALSLILVTLAQDTIEFYRIIRIVMDTQDNINNFDLEDYNVNIRMVTFIVVIMVIVLTLVYFIRIYSNKKEIVLKEMQAEANLIDTVITEHLNYSKYFIYLISSSIQANYKNLDFIKEKLNFDVKSSEFGRLFGWRKYSWIDKDYLEVVTNTSGIIKSPEKKDYLREIVEDKKNNANLWHENITFYTSKSDKKSSSLKIIDKLTDAQTGEYAGALVLSYDIATMVTSLNMRKKKVSSNFVLLDMNYELVASSKNEIDNIINLEGEFSNNIQRVIKKLRSSNDDKELSYLDMVNGLNYYVKHLDNLPFTIIVNIDNNILKMNILDSVTKKFVEVSVFAIFCLCLVISIYRRETSLRSKAEKATIAANEATKAKTNFLAFTAHEIRSPLGFVLTGSEIMTKQLFGPLPQSYTKYAEGIYKNSKIILEFITDILDENQILEGKFKIINNFEEITSIAEEAIKQTIARYNKSNIEVIQNFENDLPLVVCDRRRILQVISNLVSNSIKYSKDDIKITISIHNLHNGLEIEVADNGIGMSKKDVAVALCVYGTAQGPSSYAFDSYGLGLPIVKMLLDAHEAKFDIDSTPGHGTTVKITFPKYKLVYNTAKNKQNNERT